MCCVSQDAYGRHGSWLGPSGRRFLLIGPFGMTDPDGRERFVEGIGRDLVTVVHRRLNAPNVVVETTNRLTHYGPAGASAISEEDCRRSCAVVLVLDLPGTNRENLERRIELVNEQLKSSEDREILVDGEARHAEEAVSEGRMIVWHLLSAVFVYQLGPVALRSVPVDLRRLRQGEVPLPDGWDYSS